MQQIIAGTGSAPLARPLRSRGAPCPASNSGVGSFCPRTRSTAPSRHACSSLPRGRVAAALEERVLTEEPPLLGEEIDDERFHQELQKRLSSFGSEQDARPGQTGVGDAGLSRSRR